MPFDTDTPAPQRTLSGVTIIPHTEAGHRFIGSTLRMLGPAGVEYRQALAGVRICLDAHRRAQADRWPLSMSIKPATTRQRVRDAIARVRRATRAVAGPAAIHQGCRA